MSVITRVTRPIFQSIYQNRERRGWWHPRLLGSYPDSRGVHVFFFPPSPFGIRGLHESHRGTQVTDHPSFLPAPISGAGSISCPSTSVPFPGSEYSHLCATDFTSNLGTFYFLIRHLLPFFRTLLICAASVHGLSQLFCFLASPVYVNLVPADPTMLNELFHTLFQKPFLRFGTHPLSKTSSLYSGSAETIPWAEAERFELSRPFRACRLSKAVE